MIPRKALSNRAANNPLLGHYLLLYPHNSKRHTIHLLHHQYLTFSLATHLDLIHPPIAYHHLHSLDIHHKDVRHQNDSKRT